MKENWKNVVVFGLIVVLACLTVFFSTRYYRNELILSQAQTIQQQQAVLVETNRLLNEIKWSPESIQTWRNLGYVFQTKLPVESK